MVGRLVEHQKVGGAQHQPGQGDTHPPPTREVLHRSISVGPGEPEAVEHPSGLGLDAVAAEGLEAVLHLAVGGQCVLVGVVVLVRSARPGRCDVRGQAGELVLEVGDVRRAAHHLLDDGAIDLLGELLGQVADPAALGDVHLTGVGALQADDDLQDRGLAHAVAADERDPSSRHQPERDVGEEGAAAVGLGESGDGDQEVESAATALAQR